MTVHYQGHGVVVHAGDCLDVLAGMGDATVDSVVTDPPYGLEFMGKEWDRLCWDDGKATTNNEIWREQQRDAPRKDGGWASMQESRVPRYDPTKKAGPAMQAWHHVWAAECLRVLKPGGHLLAFGGTRTSHRLASAIEDAGFEIRDSIVWLYGSGFPKSLDVGKAIDRAAGAEREVVGVYTMPADSTAPGYAASQGLGYGSTTGVTGHRDVTAPATDAARTWDGWGTALKPAHEPIVVARKPLAGTVAGNVQAHGTGALNIDGCRIGMSDQDRAATTRNGSYGETTPGDIFSKTEMRTQIDPTGRWPANVVLSHADDCGDTVCAGGCPVATLDKQSGEQRDGVAVNRNRDADNRTSWYGTRPSQTGDDVTYGGAGGASRYFYVTRRDEAWPESSSVNGAAPSSTPPSGPDGSAPSGAATSEHPEGSSRPHSRAPSTNVTANGSRPNGGTGTPPTPSTDAKSSPVSPPTRPTATASPASPAELNAPTGITTTTPSPSTSDGSADPAISGTMPSSPERGGPGLPIDTLTNPAFYTAKASTAERVRLPQAGAGGAWREAGIRKRCANCGKQEVNMPGSACACDVPDFQPDPSMSGHTSHPTVKPLDLMRWLVRLVTPPGGVVLDPFAGSGTTAEAALLEGFRCITIEREPDYLPLIVQRINRRRDPVAATRAAPDEPSLFDLLEGA